MNIIEAYKILFLLMLKINEFVLPKLSSEHKQNLSYTLK